MSDVHQAYQLSKMNTSSPRPQQKRTEESENAPETTCVRTLPVNLFSVSRSKLLRDLVLYPSSDAITTPGRIPAVPTPSPWPSVTSGASSGQVPSSHLGADGNMALAAHTHTHTHTTKVQNLGAQKSHFLAWGDAGRQAERLKLMA